MKISYIEWFLFQGKRWFWRVFEYFMYGFIVTLGAIVSFKLFY